MSTRLTWYSRWASADTHLSQSNVADTLVVGVGLEVGAVHNVVKVLDLVLVGHLSMGSTQEVTG